MTRRTNKNNVRFEQALEKKSYNNVKVGLKQGSKLDLGSCVQNCECFGGP